MTWWLQRLTTNTGVHGYATWNDFKTGIIDAFQPANFRQNLQQQLK